MKYAVEEKFLTVNQWSRPGRPILGVKALVMHWYANPGTNENHTWRWFEDKKNGKTGYGSAHYVIGPSGRTLLLAPKTERLYHCDTDLVDPASGKVYTDLARAKFGLDSCTLQASPNRFSFGIEMAHVDWDGNFTPETLEAARQLCADLCKEYKLNPLEDIITHYQVVGWKDCPRLWTKRPELLVAFKESVKALMSGG